MIEKSCKIELRDIDFLEFECEKCKSRSSFRGDIVPSRCFSCGSSYDSLLVGLADNFLNYLKDIKKHDIKTKVSFIKIEEQ